MHAYDPEPTRSTAMKPVWIVDDDRSIRWVLEKALAREGIPYKTFASAYEVMARRMAWRNAPVGSTPRPMKFKYFFIFWTCEISPTSGEQTAS